MAKRVLIVGGIGRLESRYRTQAERLGLDLI